MGFETLVLEIVKPKLGDTGVAGFTYGTLFVDNITEQQAKSVREVLVNSTDIKCNIEVNRIGQTSEYAYDFV